jgi:hypothetical protein
MTFEVQEFGIDSLLKVWLHDRHNITKLCSTRVTITAESLKKKKKNSLTQV